jgi:hypothetical protein
VDFVREKSDLTGLPESFFIQKIGIWPDKFISWKKRYGKANEHNGNIPRDHWLEAWEKDEIVAFYTQHQSDGYRRCTYMMIDQDVVYASPATVYRVLSNADVMRKWNRGKSSKGTGFEQPMRPHEHWHIDIANVRIKGIHYFLITILDGYSRYIVHWDLRERMKDEDIGVVQQRAKELFPGNSRGILAIMVNSLPVVSLSILSRKMTSLMLLRHHITLRATESWSGIIRVLNQNVLE